MIRKHWPNITVIAAWGVGAVLVISSFVLGLPPAGVGVGFLVAGSAAALVVEHVKLREIRATAPSDAADGGRVKWAGE